MKMLPRISVTLLSVGVLLASVGPVAGQAVVETTTTSSGTISEFNPDAIVIRTSSSSAPVRYTSTRTTTYVDENGIPVSIETVKSGLPATVYFVREGDQMVASKIVVKRAAAQPVTVTSSMTGPLNSSGVISEIQPDTMSIRADASAEPSQYRYTKATSYVDEGGATVPRDAIRAGLPVTVYFRRSEGRLLAYKVVVHPGPVVEPVIEEKKTTTTTTTTGSK